MGKTTSRDFFRDDTGVGGGENCLWSNYKNELAASGFARPARCRNTNVAAGFLMINFVVIHAGRRAW